MPMGGMDAFAKGFGLTDNLMKQLLERRELKQKQDQFKEELALKKQAAARAGANSDIHRRILEQQLLGLQHKNDPNWESDQFNRMFGDGGQGGQSGAPQGDQYPDLKKMFAGQGMFPEGEMEHGNIDLGNRPHVPNPETGGESTVWSMSIGTPKGEVLIPRVSMDGRILSKKEATDQFHKTGEHLGIYSSPEEANKAAEAIHKQQAQSVGAKPGQHLLDVLRNDPIKRAYFKHKYKFDPLAVDKGAALTGAARDAESMQKLREQYGTDSPIVKEAEAINHAKQQQHEDLNAIRHRQLNGLKPGDTEIKDPSSGQVIGFRKQTTDKQKDAAKNTVLFNQLYRLVYKVADKLSGPGATKHLYDAARTYKTNPASRKLIDDFYIAEKAATTTAVTEASRFGAGKTNQTFNRFAETIKSEDLNGKLKKWIKEFGIPGEASLKAGKQWQEELNKAEKLANKKIPATMDYYFDPDKQFAHQQEQMVNPDNENNDPLGIR